VKKIFRHILSTFGGKAIHRATLEGVCRKFEADPRYTLNYMSFYGYLVRVVNGVYYVKTLDEFSSKRAVDVHRIISLGLDALGVEWYFGLNTALQMNGATHEYSDTVFVVSDKVYRNEEVKVAKSRVRFIKISHRLLGFGVAVSDGLRFSDLEKTLLDMIYLSKYRSMPEGRIAAMVEEYSGGVDRGKVEEYLDAYPLNVGKVARDAGLI